MMELDSNDLEDYLNNQDNAATAAAVAAAAAVAFSMPPPLPGSLENDARSMLNAGDIDAIVAENVQELRRRSIASAFASSVGPDYLDMTAASDASAYTSMVSPNSIVSGDAFSLSPSVSQIGLSTTVTFPVVNSTQTDMSSGMMDATGGDNVTQQLTMFSSMHNIGNTNQILIAAPITNSAGPGPMQPSFVTTSNPMLAGMMSDFTSVEPTRPEPSRFEGMYSSSGFDMLDILYRVATRPSPQINIGAVDMSCSFVVTDARKYDNPIVYCSATFERLTGYSKHEILGRNCRFLQSPDGDVRAGVKRKYVDDNTVWYLRNQIDNKKEAQASLINYRKGGQPFMNLLTTIPITWDSSEIAYFVGFQVDLVEQPGSILNKNQDGSYAINYQYSQLPKYIPVPPQERRTSLTVPRDDVSHVLNSIANGESELSKRIWDKVLLENTDDVVHVLSLKGLFLYCSPAIRKVLEYEPQELVGTALSSVCHPSDIVPVTRDLKEYSGSSINVVFRIRRKYSGYTWFESHGCLHTEQGKGRKSIILVGRERPVYVLQWKELELSQGIQDTEIWTKMSTTGMFLYVSSNIKVLLDHSSEELFGTSIQGLMRGEGKLDIGKALDSARNGRKCSVKHEIQNKRGQFVNAVTFLFPGDGNDKKKPTFLIAQTRLLKHTRGGSSNSPKVHIPSAGTASTPCAGATTATSLSSSSPPSQPSSNGSQEVARPGSSILGQNADSPDDNIFDELKTTRSTSWQYELRQMQRANKKLVEELNALQAAKKKRKRRRGVDQLEKDCANCHTRVTPEWRRGPSGKRDLCNSCGLRYAKLVGRVSPRTNTNASTSQTGDTSPSLSSPTTNSHSTTLSMVVEGSPATVNSTSGPGTPLSIAADGSGLPPPRKKSLTIDNLPKLNNTPVQPLSAGSETLQRTTIDEMTST